MLPNIKMTFKLERKIDIYVPANYGSKGNFPDWSLHFSGVFLLFSIHWGSCVKYIHNTVPGIECMCFVCLFILQILWQDLIQSSVCPGYLPLRTLISSLSCVCIMLCLQSLTDVCTVKWHYLDQSMTVLFLKHSEYPNPVENDLTVKGCVCVLNWPEANSTYGTFSNNCLYITVFMYDAQECAVAHGCCNYSLSKLALLTVHWKTP